MKSQIGRWGNSLAFRLPKHIVKELSLQVNDEVYCHLENGKLIIEPVRAIKEYTLNELLEGVIDKSEEVSWGKLEGEEVW